MTGAGPDQADHLCVLIHGLWGNPDHLKYLVESLEKAYGNDKIVTLVCNSNSGNFTYDGIDVGAERVAKEIKSYIKQLGDEDRPIRKFSVVGYSLGGLVARYAIGVLHHDGLFDKIQPVNFTTFATPHLGTRTPLNLWTSRIFNTFGPRVVSASGQQLFVMDKFRDTGKSLLEVMTDPESIFIHALASFETRTIYANIINDRLASFYTTAISPMDPYADTDLSKLKFNFVKGYEPVVINGSDPCRELQHHDTPSKGPSFAELAQTSARKVATACAMTVAAPIFATGFLLHSAVETYRSQRRIQVHSSSEETLSNYRIPTMLNRIASDLEDKAEEIANAPSNVETDSSKADQPTDESSDQLEIVERQLTNMDEGPEKLALLPGQFAMIEALDKVGIDKFHVYIRETNWTHAAIIVRKPTSAFDEGKVVVRHWLERQFRI